MHEKTVLRVFPKVVTIFTRDPDFAERNRNHTQSADLIRPILERFIDLVLNFVGPVRISFKKGELRVENIEFSFRFRRDQLEQGNELQRFFMRKSLRVI